MSLRYLSVCSGIEAGSVAWQPLGWSPVAFAEIEPFPCAVLHHHHTSGRPMFMPSPDDDGIGAKERARRRAAIKGVSLLPEQCSGVPNFGDLNRFKEWPDATVDLLCGGTPCQSFSVAGLREGLADPRGNLTLTYLAIAERYRPEWLVWENVPGVLSVDGGRAFGAFLGGMAKLGYGWAYRVLDAQYVRVDGFGRAVPQRRRRVFVVGYLGDWRYPATVLFERESLSGNPPPRREAGKGIAGTIGASLDRGGTIQDAYADQFVAHALRAEGFDAGEDGTGRGTPLIAFDTTQITSKTNRCNPQPGDPCHPLAAGAHPPAVAFDMRGREGGSQFEAPHDTANLRAASGGSSRSYVAERWAVRRLTPRECERLQGFPDNYTDVPYGKRNATPDGPRYKALGNSWAVNAARWVGYRIEMVRRLTQELAA